MKIQFDATQPYQLDAIRAVLDVFIGQGAGTKLGSAVDLIESGASANQLTLADETLLANARAVQARNGIAESDALAGLSPELEAAFANFSIEMETGTGKTYVYLRTIFELHVKYGWSKFIIVVPSVAIREGVLASLRLMQAHFRALYKNVAVDSWVYDSKQISRVRQFALGNQLQLMVMNIDAFNKSANVINVENDRLSGRKPLEFIQDVRPIVVMDEPQNMETEPARAAIANLHPLFTLRYSATHRNAYQLLYRLTPVDAYDLRLVKRIEVQSILDEPQFNGAYVALKAISATKTKITAKIEIDVNGKDGPHRSEIKLSSPKHQTSLYELSGKRDAYKNLYVEELNFGNKKIVLSDGTEIELGQATGARQDEVMRTQVFETVREHFEKELALYKKPPAGGRVKVLSLFFIDRVANYVNADGKIRQWFEIAYRDIAAKPAYAVLQPLPVERVHNGYFAQTKGVAKDSSGTTAADDEAYELIMRDKERLLSLDEPLRFIFSHSALREGWDNPNVFQICTLNETKSETKKRQEIGRGLRLAVMENGERCRDENVNRLTVVANESYVDFAAKLQTEIETETGQKFADRIVNSKTRKRIHLKKNWQLNEDFKALWERISAKTRYAVQFRTEDLIANAAKRLNESETLRPAKIAVKKAEISWTSTGAATTVLSVREREAQYRDYRVPDLCTHIQRSTELTRSAVARIVLASGRTQEIRTNPQQFLDQAVAAIRFELKALMISGLKYENAGGEAWDQMLFESEELYGYLTNAVPVENSIFEETVFDSQIERTFAEEMSKREDVKLCVKLPSWFFVETPIGRYNPDWAIVLEHETKVYLVRETKGTRDIESLAPDERDKVKCGAKHFEAINVDFEVVTSSHDVFANSV